MAQPSSPNIVKGAFAGFVAGAVATWMMTQFQTLVPPETFKELLGEDDESEDDSQNSESEEEKEESEPATVQVAEAISQAVLQREIPDNQKPIAGQAVHYLFGMATGKTYGMIAEHFPAIAYGNGLPFGAVFWLGADEIGVPAAGLSDPPWEHPASTHLYSLTAHLVYGLTLETVRRLVRSYL